MADFDYSDSEAEDDEFYFFDNETEKKKIDLPPIIKGINSKKKYFFVWLFVCRLGDLKPNETNSNKKYQPYQRSITSSRIR